MYYISTHKYASLVVNSFCFESSVSRSVLLSPTPHHTGVSGKASTAANERVDLLWLTTNTVLKFSFLYQGLQIDT